MRPSLLVHVVWSLVALIALATGYFLAEPTRGPLGADSGTIASLAASSRQSSSPVVGDEENLKLSGSHGSEIAAREVHTRAFDALAEPNRFSRVSALCELLKGVSRENWRGVFSAFKQQAISEGRLQGEDWNLVLEHVGAVAGADAIEEVLASSNASQREPATLLLLGWAEADAKAAHAWFQTRRSDIMPVELAQTLSEALIAGAARSDSETALAYFHDDVGLNKNIPAIVDAAIQRGGLKEGEAVVAKIAARPDVRDFVKSKFIETIVQRKYAIGEMSGESLGQVTWLEPYLSEPWAVDAIYYQVARAAKVDAPAVMRWLEPRLARMSPQGAAWALRVIAPIWHEQAPEQFVARLSAPAEFPGQESLAHAAAMELLRKNAEAKVREWTETFQNPKSRAAVERAVADHEVMKQRNAAAGR